MTELLGLLIFGLGVLVGRLIERHTGGADNEPRLVAKNATVYTFRDIPPDHSAQWRTAAARFCALLEAVQRERRLDPWRVPSYSAMQRATGAGVPKLRQYYDVLREARVIRVTGRAVTRWTCPRADRRRLIAALPYRQTTPPPDVPAVGTAEQGRTVEQ